MTDQKISDLTALTGADLATGDLFEAVDVSDTTMAASGTNKKMTGDELVQGLRLLRPRASASKHLPTGALAATYDRGSVNSAAQAVLTSGTLVLVGIDIEAGQTITSISFKSGTTALATGTHQFFGIADSSRAVQRWTSDDTSTAWGTTTVKTLNLTSAYVIPSTGTYYLAIMVAASTVPNLIGIGPGSQAANIAPILCGNTSDTGLTTPPGLPFTAGAITSGTTLPYAWVA